VVSKSVEEESGRGWNRMRLREKFGGRIHVNHVNDVIRQRIEVAKQESFRTCEICG
jgi:hypothetical protein